MSLQQLTLFLNNPKNIIAKIVDFDNEKDNLLALDFTAKNTELSPQILNDTAVFSDWVNQKLAKSNAKYGIGGYNEHRTIYTSTHFNTQNEPRRLHLGTDIWGKAGTRIYNFYTAKVHSFNFNNNFGDYGATIILQYQIPNLTFYALYGHLSLASLTNLKKGLIIPAGKQFASFGIAAENGFWPPHLHFQLIFDIASFEGDYPGVCKYSEREKYLQNCPNPTLILKHTFTSALL
jgi:peptidoglycan LD-endopeptidase LytH